MIKRSLGYVYLIRKKDSNIYKIDVSKNDPTLRLKSLQTGNETELVLEYHIQSKCYTSLESTLHRTYKYDNLHGEWFEFTNKDIIIDTIQKTNNQLESLIEMMNYA